jgi:hypothetical protein
MKPVNALQFVNTDSQYGAFPDPEKDLSRQPAGVVPAKDQRCKFPGTTLIQDLRDLSD